ncbi:MAG: type II secretion system F family protein [Planctomycetota bacterium]
MTELAIGITGLLGAWAVGVYWHLRRVRRWTRERLFEDRDVAVRRDVERADEAAPRAVSRLGSPGWIPLLAATGAAIFLVTLGIPTAFVVALAMNVGLMCWVILDWWHERRSLRFERQLADALELMVSSLRAGAGVLDAMRTATRESRRPLRGELERVVGRIRYGESPREVFEDLAERVPFESFELFALALGVHWEVGGRLSKPLGAVASFIRDRVEMRRSIQTQTTQTKLSVLAITSIAYFVAAVMWRSDPARMSEFLSSTVGGAVCAFVMILQGIGYFWIVRMARVEY